MLNLDNGWQPTMGNVPESALSGWENFPIRDSRMGKVPGLRFAGGKTARLRGTAETAKQGVGGRKKSVADGFRR